MRPIIIFIALCLIRNSIQKMEYYEKEITTKKKILCVQTAFRKYLKDHSKVLIFSVNPNNIVNSLPRLPHFVATHFDSVRNISSIDSGAVIVFLEGNGEQDFNDLKRLLDFVTVQPVLLVCITNAVCSSEMYINKIVKMVKGEQLHYVAVDDGGIIDIYKYTTTAEENCGVAQLARLGHCSDKSTFKKAFEIPVNFHECPIRVATKFNPPYSEPCNSDDSNHLCGIEGNVVQDIVKTVNATPSVVTVQTRQDVRHLVAHRYADIGFGNIHLQPGVDVSYSVPYLVLKGTVAASYSTWAVKGSISDIIIPFKLQVWISVAIAIVFIFILRVLVPYFRRMNALQVFGMIIGIPVLRPPLRLSSRIYFLSLVFFGYHCSQLYLANLTKVLSTSRQPMINTLDDLENSNLQVTGLHLAREFFKDDFPRIYRDFQVLDHQTYKAQLEKLFRDRSSSVVYIEATDVNFAYWNKIKRIEEEVSWFPISMVVSNSSTVLRTTNKVLMSIVESGIMKEYVDIGILQYKRMNYDRSGSVGECKVLDLGELQGVFFLFIGGLSLSILVFLIEIMIPFIKTKLGNGLKRRGKIYPEWLRQRHVRRILLPKQTSRASRR